jgi:hypothetical protein
MRKKRRPGWRGGNEGSSLPVDLPGASRNAEAYGAPVAVPEVLGVSGIGSWGDNGYAAR